MNTSTISPELAQRIQWRKDTLKAALAKINASLINAQGQIQLARGRLAELREAGRLAEVSARECARGIGFSVDRMIHSISRRDCARTAAEMFEAESLAPLLRAEERLCADMTTASTVGEAEIKALSAE